jgi:ubiquinone/menaquinone biosynthesis C-methylase UbiE
LGDNVDVKRQVREFYDKVGWKEVGEGVYQNARYEDLRPVSREYIHRCHLRVTRHLKPDGYLLLDAGSGPIQYPEYLEYSRNYDYRVCLDVSIVALKEARKRIGEHGLFVVADVSRLPFKAEVFDGLVSLHTIHHLPQNDHIRAYRELHRVLQSGCKAVVVNGWYNPPLGRLMRYPIKMIKRLRGQNNQGDTRGDTGLDDAAPAFSRKGTFTHKYNAAWLNRQLSKFMRVDILVWRTLSVAALRFYIRPHWRGKRVLRAIYWLEERFPRFLGKYGQYPLIVLVK